MVHFLEKIERHDEVPVLVRLDDILQLLRKRGPEDIVRKVQALRKAVQLAYLQLARFRELARVEDEFDELFLGHEAE